MREAKAIYPLMGIAANVALVAAGNFMKLVSARLAVRARSQPLPCWHTGPPLASHAAAAARQQRRRSVAPVARMQGASVLLWSGPACREPCALQGLHEAHPRVMVDQVWVCMLLLWQACTHARWQGSELACLRVLVATVLGFTGVIYGAELFVERRVAVACHIDPVAGGKAAPRRKGSLADAVQVCPTHVTVLVFLSFAHKAAPAA